MGITASGVSASVPYTGGNGGSHACQTVTSAGVTGLSTYLYPGVFNNGNGNLIFYISGTPVSSGNATFALNIGGQACNLGAAQIATSSTDAAAYGDLFEWGRLDDGHQVRTSPTTTTLSDSDVPGHGSFILAPDSPYDWRSPQNNNLWQGEGGNNNPCPNGYRLPTYAEWDAERASWSTNNTAGAFASPLKLPIAGYRSHNDGSIYNDGSYGYYWSSTVAGFYSTFLYFFSGDALMIDYPRAFGLSARCLKD